MSVCFITGINGFIGSHIAAYLQQCGHQVRGLVRRTSDLRLLQSCQPDLTFGDITDAQSLATALQGVDVLIHVAGLASDWDHPEKFRAINVTGTQNVAEMAAGQKVKRLVYISSAAIHGFRNQRFMHEDDPLPETIFPYVNTKRRAEQWLFEFSKNTTMEITALRPGNVFGPHDHTFIEKYLTALLQGKLAYIDRGRHWTCPTYIENLLQAVELACFHEQAPGEAFIITDGLDIDWHTFTEAFARALGIPAPRLSIPFGLAYGLAWMMEMGYRSLRLKRAPLLTRYRICNGGRDYHFSIEKAQKILGYQPTVGFTEAVQRTAQWFGNRSSAKKGS